MDLIYTNHEKVDIGVLFGYDLDLAFGSNENNFECTISSDMHCCEAGYFLHIEGTEYGGIIDGIEVDSEKNEVVYSGRTWHGLLESSVIIPLTSSDRSTQAVTVLTSDSDGSLVDKYLVISGDANRCIEFIVERIGLSSLFTVPLSPSGAFVDRYQFDRYTNSYEGLTKMLSSVGMKLKFEYNNGNVVLSCIPKLDYSNDEEFDTSTLNIKIKCLKNSVNHLICLGKGELEKRTVIHLYTDAEGNISEEQTLTGLDEYTVVYDYSNVESEEELKKQGTELLEKLWEPDKMVINLDDSSDRYGIGDVVGATDSVTGISGKATIVKKIVKISNEIISISYEVGD